MLTRREKELSLAAAEEKGEVQKRETSAIAVPALPGQFCAPVTVSLSMCGDGGGER